MKMSPRTVVLLLASLVVSLLVLWAIRSSSDCAHRISQRAPDRARLVEVQDEIVQGEALHPVEPCRDDMLLTPKSLVSLLALLLWAGTVLSYGNDLYGARKLKRNERRRRRSRSSRRGAAAAQVVVEQNRTEG